MSVSLKSTFSILILFMFFSSCNETDKASKIVGTYIQSHESDESVQAQCIISHIKENTYGVKFRSLKKTAETTETYFEGTLNVTERILAVDMKVLVVNLQFDEDYQTGYHLNDKTITLSKQ